MPIKQLVRIIQAYFKGRHFSLFVLEILSAVNELTRDEIAFSSYHNHGVVKGRVKEKNNKLSSIYMRWNSDMEATEIGVAYDNSKLNLVFMIREPEIELPGRNAPQQIINLQFYSLNIDIDRLDPLVWLALLQISDKVVSLVSYKF